MNQTETFTIQSPTETGQRVEKYYKDRILDKFRAVRENLIEQLQTNASHALEWNTEDVMLREELNFIWQRLVRAVRVETSDETCKKTVLDHVRQAAKHCLRFPPRHNSTGEVHNLHEIAKNQAWCDFVQDASMLIGDHTYALD